MQAEEAQALYERALRRARRLGFGERAEDIAQEIVLKRLQGRGTRQSLDHAAIDEVRHWYGRTPVHEVSIDDVQIADKEISPDLLGELVRGRSGLNRAIFLLIHQWGFTEAEVGYLFGVTESRICQRLKGVQARLSSRVAEVEEGNRPRVPGQEVRPGEEVPRGWARQVQRPDAVEVPEGHLLPVEEIGSCEVLL